MSVVRTKGRDRGSKYSKKIDPIKFYVAYEGELEEKEYFNSLKGKVPKRFRNNIEIIAVDKSSSKSSPEYVFLDLKNKVKEDGVKLNSSSVSCYIVIDTDHHFTGTHQKSTKGALSSCRDNGVKVLRTNPCFEIWLIMHFLDIDKLPEKVKVDLYENKRVGTTKFCKKKWREVKGGYSYDEISARVYDAVSNEKLLNLPLECNVGDLINDIHENGFYFN